MALLWQNMYWNCTNQPPASIGSLFTCLFVPHCNTLSYLHYMMFLTIQTIYFLWGYDPGNMSVSFIAELSPVYCCLVCWVIQSESDWSSISMPPVAKKTVIPNHPKSRVWGYFGDSEDGETATCLLCKYTKKSATHIIFLDIWMILTKKVKIANTWLLGRVVKCSE